MAGIKVEGLDKLAKKLKDNVNLDDVKRVVRKNGADLQRKMQRKADFHGHMEYVKGKGLAFVAPTGATKRSIDLQLADGGFTASSGPTTEYAEYLEYGTRFMEAQPFVNPAARHRLDDRGLDPEMHCDFQFGDNAPRLNVFF